MANLHCRLKFDLGENEIHRKEERVKDSKIAKFLLKSVVKYEKFLCKVCEFYTRISQAVFSVLENISQPNLAILPILRCSFEVW